jgi:hypothetical protein
VKPTGFFAATVVVAVALLLPSEVHAQRRGGRVAVPRANIVVLDSYRPFYGYRAFYYDPWFYSYGWYPPYAYGPRYFDDSASLRLQVTPKEAEVFVDGYYAGRVDDFDGTFQRLHLDRGEHDLTLYLDGYRSVRQRIYLQPNATFKVHYDMEKLRPGDTQEPRPTASATPNAEPGRRTDRGLSPRGLPPARRDAPERGRTQAGDRADAGSLSLRVQPGNAEVRIDGERWDGSGSDDRLVVQLAPGQHRVEIRRDGYRSYENDVTVRRGETTTLNVSLSRE